MDKICLFGASGHGKVIKQIALSMGKEVVTFFDDKPTKEHLGNTQILSSNKIKEFVKLPFVISIGDNKIRKLVSEKIKTIFTTLIHKNANICSNVEIGEGSVVMAGAIINTDVKIGNHCIVNTGSVVEHDCEVGSYVHLSPNVTLTGNVKVGEGTHIGGGSVVVPNTSIGKWVVIGAGSVILKDIPDYSVVVGNPGKIIKSNKE
jgi:acetyltransferase EpsM